ncbi:hypothetical protein GCM10011487_41010 [Steroidobacter agaridevorans]|uniref:Uncharacterized protein n=1 Tax=Steroidobacter agaridevorans TaxID=2695856 RepID=A0A829YH04_9GAMM|nr:DUF6445 family protein [Steroidobacter agaridevorans]GFE82101.1 hypothetical protein GCM10011487_41010 [Steroidobacter agaridevorans]
MSGGPTLFAFNDHAEIELVRIGRGGLKVSVIDKVLRDPEGVAALGLAQSFAEDRGNLYPGLRAAMPDSFSTSFRAWLTPTLQRNGMLESRQVISGDTSFFSVVATASKDLRPIQCIPHYDSTDPSLFAAVIYLCGPRFFGTAFYRHRRTGYEAITEQNASNYQLALNSDMRMQGPPEKQYINGDTVLFETVFASELKFNRAIVYPARILHAARIENPFHPPKDRSEWRLTVTALLRSSRL